MRTPSGLQYQDLRPGEGPVPKPGASVTVDWDGYTIGCATAAWHDSSANI